MRLLTDEAGFIISIEMILVATIAVLGIIAGIASVRDSIVSELGDLAGGVQNLNQCYTVRGLLGHSARICGFAYFDYHDFCDVGSDHSAGESPVCIRINAAATDES